MPSFAAKTRPPQSALTRSSDDFGSTGSMGSNRPYPHVGQWGWPWWWLKAILGYFLPDTTAAGYAFVAIDAVDGAHATASMCQRVVALSEPL